MSNSTMTLLRQVAREGQACRVGRIVRIRRNGRPIVTYSTSKAGGVEARVLSDVSASSLSREGRPVLLLFPDGEGEQPIILGTVSDRVEADSETAHDRVVHERLLGIGRPDAILVDNERVVIEAQSEVLLKCGESSILLRRDGKVVLKGKQLVSRASKTNKIRGGSVLIN